MPRKFAMAARTYARCCRSNERVGSRVVTRVVRTVSGVRKVANGGFKSGRGPLLISMHSKTETSVPNVVSAVLGLKLGRRIIRALTGTSNGPH